jgi:F-type H+-transporting ATPase subunit delta
MTAENTGHRLAFDSERQYLGAVYAKALLGATEKLGQTDQVLSELESFVQDVLAKMPKFEAVLASTRIGHEEKITLLEQAVGKTMQPTLLTFLKVVARHGRLDCLRAILTAAHKQLNEMRGRVEVLVESAAPLDETLRNEVRQQLKKSLGREVIIRERVNPEILGGLVVRVGDTVFDASVAQQLRRLRRSALAATRQTMRNSLDRFASST